MYTGGIMQQFITKVVTELGTETPNFSAFGIVGIVITMVIALLYCFFGYRFLKFFIALIGFMIGFGLGFFIGMKVSGNVQAVGWILAVIIGIALGVVSFFLYKAGIFIVTFFMIFFLVFTFTYERLPAPWPPVVSLAAGLAAAILAVIFVRPMVIFTSGICGGFSFSMALISDLIKWDASYANIVIFVFGIALGILGMIFQFRTTKNIRRKSR